MWGDLKRLLRSWEEWPWFGLGWDSADVKNSTESQATEEIRRRETGGGLAMRLAECQRPRVRGCTAEGWRRVSLRRWTPRPARAAAGGERIGSSALDMWRPKRLSDAPGRTELEKHVRGESGDGLPAETDMKLHRT